MIIDWIAASLVLLGSLLHLTASLGLLKFPEFLIKLHAASKATTFGVGLVLLGFAMIMGGVETWIKFTLVLVFTFISAPVVAHLFARVYLIEKSTPDETNKRYQ